MSDLELSAILDRLEAMLASEPQEELEAQAIAQWNHEFNLALADIQRGSRWPDIVVRARALKARLDQRIAILRSDQSAIRQQLETRVQGTRALAGYRQNPL